KKLKLDEEMVFYGSKMPISIALESEVIDIKLQSTQYGININTLFKAAIKQPIIYDIFSEYLNRYRLKDPAFFMALIQDTIDKDDVGQFSDESEIILYNSTFKNGAIVNRAHLDEIINYYFLSTSDAAIYSIDFNSMFTFNTTFIDLNFASKDVVDFIFYDADENSRATLYAIDEPYEKMSDLPFDDFYRKKLSKPVMGQGIGIKSSSINLTAKINSSTFSFQYTIGKNPKVSNIEMY
ncbi:MAG: hypothetical protein U9N42_00785, partial [Campylobacterota bacterium]|nr:hypothetical protein [Campylobacterota bacterium]